MSDNKDTDSPKPEDQTSAADEWADALNEQGAPEQTDTPATPDTKPEATGAEDASGDALAQQSESESESASAEDAWGDALAEQTESETTDESAADTGDSVVNKDESQPESSNIFKPLENGTGSGGSRDLDMIMEIPVTLSVELGQTRLTIRELLDLSQGSIIELDGLAGEPMDIQINGYLIAQGEVVVVDDRYGIRITDIITPSERIHKLNR